MSEPHWGIWDFLHIQMEMGGKVASEKEDWHPEEQKLSEICRIICDLDPSHDDI